MDRVQLAISYPTEGGPSPSYPTRQQWREYLGAVGLTNVGVGNSESPFLRDEPSRRYADTEGEAEGPAELPEEGSPQDIERVMLERKTLRRRVLSE
jgi:hypothetical protein